jgi:hypothetical protein
LRASAVWLPDLPGGAGGRARPLNQMLNEVLKYGRIQLVTDLLPMTFGHDEASLTQHREMPGDRWPTRVELRRDFPRRERSIAQQAEDATTSLVGECAKRPVRGAQRTT